MQDGEDAQWLTTNISPVGGIAQLNLRTVLHHYDVCADLVVRDANQRGGAKTLIAEADYGRFSCSPSGTRRTTPDG